MRTLLAATLVLRASTAHDETSLMQGLARRVDAKLGVDGARSGHDTSRLMETATKMLKSGAAATPTVERFISSTIQEIQHDVTYYILKEHQTDQESIIDCVRRKRQAIADVHSDIGRLTTQEADYRLAIDAHKGCRQTESVYCSDSRLCEIELERLWERVKEEEGKLRELHHFIYGEICIPPPSLPCTENCWNWPHSLAMEGPETSETSETFFRGPGEAVFQGKYPLTDYSQELKDHRYYLAFNGNHSYHHGELPANHPNYGHGDVHWSPSSEIFEVTRHLGLFQRYLLQKPIVEEAWTAYNQQIILCAEKYDTLQQKTADCDYTQDTVAQLNCGLHEDHNQHCRDYGSEIQAIEEECALLEGACHLVEGEDCAPDDDECIRVHTNHTLGGAFANGCTGIRGKEWDRKREWHTLHIVKCLLETVYTHVVHAIETGEPCPTMESDPDGVTAAINRCHVTNHDFCPASGITHEASKLAARSHVDQDFSNAEVFVSCQKTMYEPSDPRYNVFCDDVLMMNDDTHDHDARNTPTLCIDYCGDDNLAIPDLHDCPDPPTCPPPIAPLCTAEFLMETVANFGPFIDNHQDAELESAHAHLSEADWGGCAAPKACLAIQREHCPAQVDLMLPAVVFEEMAGECHHVSATLVLGESDAATFRCHDSKCVPIAARCNGYANCDDGSDELGCGEEWGHSNVELSDSAVCFDSSVTTKEAADSQFICNDGSCTSVEGRCNGIPNCADGSDELGCRPGVAGVVLEPTSGHPAHLDTAAINGPVFGDDDHTGHAIGYARRYTFKSLGNFAGKDFIRFSNEDKSTSHDHVQMKLRFSQPTTVFVMTQFDPLTKSSQTLPWLASDGWVLRTDLQGVEYSGLRQTPAKEWAEHRGHAWMPSADNLRVARLEERDGPTQENARVLAGSGPDDHLDEIDLEEMHYGTAEVWEKTFPAGVVEMRGNGGGEGYNWAPGVDGGHGSYLMFLENPRDLVAPPPPGLPGHAEYIGCFVDDPARDMGDMVGSTHNAATNTFNLCRQACGNHQFMSLQYGGECFCANSYSTESKYRQVDDAMCNRVVEPCSSNSHNCGGTWHQAIYRIGSVLGRTLD